MNYTMFPEEYANRLLRKIKQQVTGMMDQKGTSKKEHSQFESLLDWGTPDRPGTVFDMEPKGTE